MPSNNVFQYSKIRTRKRSAKKSIKTGKKMESSTFWNPESTVLESGIQYPESGIHSMESRIQDCPGFPYMGRCIPLKLPERMFLKSLHIIFIMYIIMSETWFWFWCLKLIHCNTLKFQDKPVLRTGQKSALQHSLFWRYANFSKLISPFILSRFRTINHGYDSGDDFNSPFGITASDGTVNPAMIPEMILKVLSKS